MQKIKIKDVIRYELIGMLVILVGFTIFDLIPSLKTVYRYTVKHKIETKAATMRQERENVGKKQNYQENVALLKDNLGILKGELPRVEERIVAEKNLPLIVLQIEDIAGNLPIELVSMKPQESEILGNYELQPVEIRFKGDYTAVMSFIESLEELLAVTAVYDVTVNKDPLIYPRLDTRLIALIVFNHEEEAKEDSLF